MSDVPETPVEFFTEYVPRRFASVQASLAGKSSAGAMAFRVIGEGEWSVRLAAGELVIEAGVPDDVLLQVTVSSDDFKPVFVQGAQAQEDEPVRPEAQLLAFNVLTADEERVKVVHAVRGSVAFVIANGEQTHRLLVTPGRDQPNIEAPECRLECQMSDFLELLLGKQNPLQLFMAGKIRMLGNAQIPMALSSVFV